MEHVAIFLAISIVLALNNIEISERSEPKFFKVILKVHKNITENVYLSDFRGGVRLFRPPPLNPPMHPINPSHRKNNPTFVVICILTFVYSK